MRKRSGSLSSGVSHGSSEADISKDSDLSKDLDNSDIDDQSFPSRPHKKCVQRLFSPEIRTDHVIDPSSSPESLPQQLYEADNSRLPPLTEVLNNNTVLVKPEPINANTGDKHVPIQKPKIWSISEIIGSVNKTVAPENTAQYPTDQFSQSTYPAMAEHYYYSGYSTDYSSYGVYQNSSYENLGSENGQLSHNTSPVSDSEPIQYL